MPTATLGRQNRRLLFTHQKMVENIRLYQRLRYPITGREEVSTGHLVQLCKDLRDCARSLRQR